MSLRVMAVAYVRACNAESERLLKEMAALLWSDAIYKPLAKLAHPAGEGS